jgi:hypothetical protein
MNIQIFYPRFLQVLCLLCISLTLACQTPAKNEKSPVRQDSILLNKVDSRLLAAVRESKTGKIENSVPVILPEDSTGTIRVELKAKVTDSLIRFLRSCGASGVNAFNQFEVLQCGLPLNAIEKVAVRKDVYFIRPAPVMQLNNEPL